MSLLGISITQAAQQAKNSSVTVVRFCDGTIGLAASAPIQVAPDKLPDTETYCIPNKQGISNIYSLDDILNPIYSRAIGLRSRIQAVMGEFKDYPGNLIDIIVRSSKNKSTDIYSTLSNLGLNNELINFYFGLCYQVYYKTNIRKNPNARSITYAQKRVELEGELKGINSNLDRIAKFEAVLERELSQQNIARLNVEKLQKLDEKEQEGGGTSITQGKQKLSTGLEHRQTPEQFKHSQQFGSSGGGFGVHSGSGREKEKSTTTKTQDVMIKSLTPEIVASLNKEYSAIFGADAASDVKNQSISDLEDKLSKKKLLLLQAKIPTEAKLRIFSDPNLEDFWAKMELIHKNEARGFIPIDVFYRNTSTYSTPFKVLDKLAKKKDNISRRQIGKDISGVMLFKKSENIAQSPDEIIVAFSGSNSAEDWKHNLDFFKQEGLASHSLAQGLKAHRGILRSLEGSLDEAGSKIHNWMENYKILRGSDKTKPTLRITVTGHSLGGGLALLSGIFVKQVIEPAMRDVANIDLRVITFAAPPILNQQSASLVEKLISPENNLRFWTLGDPLARLSFVLKDERKVKRSPISVLLGYYHVGTSMPLFDANKAGNFIDVINPWKNHLSNRYSNLLGSNWIYAGNQEMDKLKTVMERRKVIESQSQLKSLETLINFIEVSPDSSDIIEGISADGIKDIVESYKKTEGTKTASEVRNFEALQKDKYEQGKTDPLKFKKVDLTGESKTITYLQKIPPQALNITLDRSTSCKIANLSKKFKFSTSQMNEKQKSEVSCSCCIVKNTFVSYGGGNVLQKAKDRLSRKDTKTPATILNYCEREKHCSNPDIKSKLFPNTQDLIVSFGNLMVSLGLKETWLKKEVK